MLESNSILGRVVVLDQLVSEYVFHDPSEILEYADCDVVPDIHVQDCNRGGDTILIGVQFQKNSYAQRAPWLREWYIKTHESCPMYK